MAWFNVTDTACEHWMPKGVQQPSDCDCRTLYRAYVAELGYP